jgi:DNA-binding transcriptional ArsR family regulator
MSSIRRLLSRRPSAEAIKQNREQNPDVLVVDDESADDIFSALSSATARSILMALYESPRTASEIADNADTSLQNVNYHLNNLSDSDLIEVVETWRSEQGKEMKVYAPTNEALVLFAGDDINRSSFYDVIKRFLGSIGVFAVASIAVERIAHRIASPPSQPGAGSGMGPEDPATFVFSPGLLFFLGCLLAFLVTTVWWYYQAS